MKPEPNVVLWTGDYCTARVSAETRAALDAQFPGWLEPHKVPRGPRRDRAQLGLDLFDNAAKAISRLAFEAGQTLESL